MIAKGLHVAASVSAHLSPVSYVPASSTCLAGFLKGRVLGQKCDALTTALDASATEVKALRARLAEAETQLQSARTASQYLLERSTVVPPAHSTHIYFHETQGGVVRAVHTRFLA